MYIYIVLRHPLQAIIYKKDGEWYASMYLGLFGGLNFSSFQKF